jgi:hypothetical protein
MSQVQDVVDSLLDEKLETFVTPGLGNNPSLRDAYHKTLISNIVSELEGRGDLIADPEKAGAIYTEYFPGVVSPYKSPEWHAGRLPPAILTRENLVVLSPFWDLVSTQNVLLDLLGHAIAQRLVTRSGGDQEAFFANDGRAQVLERLIRVAEKIGVDERHLMHMRESKGGLGAGTSN